MISQTVEYALRAVVAIAQHGGVPCTSQQIADITLVPAPYLSKMLQGMARSQLVSSKRGLHGGFVLKKDVAELTLWDVVEAVEPFQRIRECPLGISSHNGTLCPLHRQLDNSMAMVEQSFRETTVAAILSEEGSVTPLCEVHKLMKIDLNKAKHTNAKKKPAAKRKSI